MAGIYGPITEHPEFRIEDEGRFTVIIHPHTYAVDERRWRDNERQCWHCGNGPRHPVHSRPEGSPK